MRLQTWTCYDTCQNSLTSVRAMNARRQHRVGERERAGWAGSEGEERERERIRKREGERGREGEREKEDREGERVRREEKGAREHTGDILSSGLAA